MVLPGRPSRGDAGVAPAPGPGQGCDSLTRSVGVSPRLLAPNEHLAGTAGAPQLLQRLTALRANADVLTRDHPAVTFLRLPGALQRWQDHGLDAAPLRAGLAIVRTRYAALGLTRLLPLDRVLVGVQSSQPGAFGGFHHPNQGYRHLQMCAIVTTCGSLATGLPDDPELAALDLLRAYAHDCLHYGSFRSYRMRGDDIVRAQYGINFRRDDGRTYSVPDPAGSLTTRNLGVLMEGACDREARLVTQAVARQLRIRRDGGDIARYVYRDVTGTLDAPDLDVLRDAGARAKIVSGDTAGSFLRAMGDYQRGVNARYGVFLNEIGGDDAEPLHDVVLRAMIAGSLTSLCAWLNKRHGARSFASIFLSPGYCGRTRA